jgi:hypothetical protein
MQQMPRRIPTGASLVKLICIVLGLAYLVSHQFWAIVSIGRNSNSGSSDNGSVGHTHSMIGIAPDSALKTKDAIMLCPTIPTDNGTWSRRKQNLT